MTLTGGPVRKLLFSLSACSLSLLLPAAMKADTFQFTASSSGFSEAGLLTATSKGDGSYLVTGVTSPDITGLIAPGGFQGNDNLLFPANSRLVDVNGLGFLTSAAGVDYQVDLFSTVSGFEALVSGSDMSFYDLPVEVTLSAPASVTPEPQSLVLLGTGLLGTAAAFARRRGSRA